MECHRNKLTGFIHVTMTPDEAKELKSQMWAFSSFMLGTNEKPQGDRPFAKLFNELEATNLSNEPEGS